MYVTLPFIHQLVCKTQLYRRLLKIQSCMDIYSTVYYNCNVWCNNYQVLYPVKCCLLYFYILNVLPREVKFYCTATYCWYRYTHITYTVFGLHITFIMLNNVHHEFRCEIYLVKDDGKLHTFCGISIIIIMRIIFSFMHANHVLCV